MIFVITGTERYSFNRMLQKIDLLKEAGILKGDVFIQSGWCTYQPQYCKNEQWLSFDKMAENIKNADFVIAHAGAGTTLLCLEMGQKPLIVTRKKKYNEHLDDHQIPFAENMEKLDYAYVAYEVDEIEQCVAMVMKNKGSNSSFKKNNKALISFLNEWTIKK